MNKLKRGREQKMKLGVVLSLMILSAWSWILAEAQDVPPPPNIDQLTFTVNVLLGRTPSEQRQDLTGSKIFDFTETDDSVNGYKLYEEVKEITTTPECVSEVTSRDIWWATSTSSLQSQASKSSRGVSIEVEVDVPVGESDASASTTLQSSLIFGNSQSSATAFTQKKTGFTRSFDAFAKRSLYSVEVDYDSMTSWTEEFIQACEALGDRPRVSQLLNFFKEYGTHGLATASFGQLCTSSTFMEGSESLTSQYSFQSDSSSYDKQFLWWQSTGSQSASDEETTDQASGFRYFISDRRCEGELQDDSSCGGGMSGTGKDLPAIVAWSYMPIWKMKVPGLSQEARNSMVNLFQDIMAASVDCADNECNSNGVCAPDLGGWGDNMIDSIDNINKLGYLFDGTRCFCFDDFEGDKCDQGCPIRVSQPVFQNNWANAYDGEVSSPLGNPLCGVEAKHDNNYEDRRFKFATCKINEPGTMLDIPIGEQKTFESYWDIPFTFECELDKVMTRLHLKHNNDREDRRWTATCTHFKNTRVNRENCDNGLMNGYINKYDGEFDFSCKPGKVLTAIHSVHSNDHEDRKFKFQCCELMFEAENDNTAISRSSDWTEYLNDYDGRLIAPREGVTGFCGVQSRHNSDKEDRQFKFKYCQPGVANPGNVEGASINNNNFDEASDFSCPGDSVLTKIESYHNSHHEDRKWSYECRSYDNWLTDLCQWTDWANWYDAEFTYETGEKHVITGLLSIHNSDREDRRFKFLVCRWTKDIPRTPLLVPTSDIDLPIIIPNTIMPIIITPSPTSSPPIITPSPTSSPPIIITPSPTSSPPIITPRPTSLRISTPNTISLPVENSGTPITASRQLLWVTGVAMMVVGLVL